MRERTHRDTALKFHGLLRAFSITAVSLAVSATASFAAPKTSRNVETIVMIRHAEKPAGGLGQLNCRGLNRALALPSVLLGRWGKPDYIFAPDPGVQVTENTDKMYSYVRPLVTIEPTAIKVGMPVNTQIAFNDLAGLQWTLTDPRYAHSLIFVAWEHDNLNEFAKRFIKSYGGDPSVVPPWPNSDYGRIYIFTLTRKNGKPQLAFKIEREGLSSKLSDACPAS